MIASGYEAYDRLSPAWQKFIEGLEAGMIIYIFIFSFNIEK